MALVMSQQQLLAANVAADDAGNYSSWTNGSNGGSGFTPWELSAEAGSPAGAAGHFLAIGNGDLNFIGSPPDTRAWGTFANDGGPANGGIQISRAARSFTGGPLEIGQSFRIRMENGLVFAGNSNPNNGARTYGWAGFTLRNGTTGNLQEPIEPFGNINGQIGFGFLGGLGAYNVYDTISPSGRPVNAPFTVDGVEVTVSITGPGAYEMTIDPLNPSLATDVISGTFSGTIDSVVLYNRNTEQGDVFFNNLQVVPEPTSLGLLSMGAMLAMRRRR
jgi:hypothetical protein